MRALALALLLAAASERPAHAHGMRMAYLELVQQDATTWLVTWKTTLPGAGVAPRFPAGCTATEGATERGRHTRSFSLHCDQPLAGARLAVDGLGPVLTEAVVRVVRPDGSVLSRVLTPDAAAWTLPADANPVTVALQYVGLGVEHILAGPDHLLFLLALVLYVRRPRTVLITETAFTLSHSVSFAATALGWIHVPAAAAEACIALSLILVALDVGDPEAERNAAWQGPLIALVFGLVHGLGFAGALSEVGLPDQAVATALVAFGLGVEIGQVAFLVVVMLALGGLELTRLVPRARVALGGSYLVGVTGSYWFFQRLSLVLG